MRWNLLLTTVLFSLSASLCVAQPPLPKPGERLPDDSIEGTIWEYEGKLKGTPKEGEDKLELEGKFRIEGSAIFAVSGTITLPSAEEVKKTVKKVTEGKKIELKVPEGPQQNRIGEYKKISNGRYRLDFKDKESLNGIMIIWQRKDDAVWIGSFEQKENGKTVRNWDVQLRAIED